MTAKLQINWQNRFDALEPAALIAFDQTARRLKDKLLALNDEQLSLLQGVSGPDLLFVASSSNAQNLPWVDGVIYLGKDLLAPSIFLPTNLRPDIPIDLFEKSLLSGFSDQKPFAVVGNLIVPVGKMRPISRIVLSRIL